MISMTRTTVAADHGGDERFGLGGKVGIRFSPGPKSSPTLHRLVSSCRRFGNFSKNPELLDRVSCIPIHCSLPEPTVAGPLCTGWDRLVGHVFNESKYYSSFYLLAFVKVCKKQHIIKNKVI